jgi:hypothetical protein
MDPSKPIGRHTAAEVRGDDQALVAIASLTGLLTEDIASSLAAAHGATRVRNVFRETWPLTAASLA